MDRQFDTTLWRSRLASLPGGVAVLCGGPGGEREVSLQSGANTHQALAQAGVANRLEIAPVEGADAFVRGVDCGLAVMMFHGAFGEGGRAQEILEERGLPYTGSASPACRLAMDKAAVKALLRRDGIPTPRWATVRKAGGAGRTVAEAGLAYPLFVKPNNGGSSVCTARVNTPAELEAAVEAALPGDGIALIEEMVIGRELTVGWFDGETLPVVELNAEGEFYDYHAKYLCDKTRYTCPAPLDAETNRAIHRIAQDVVRLVGSRDVARVDVLLGPEGPMVLELNSLPGCTSHSLFPMAAAAAGMAFDQVCLRLAALAAARAGEPA